MCAGVWCEHRCVLQRLCRGFLPATGDAAQLLMFCVLFNQDFPIFLYICFL